MSSCPEFPAAKPEITLSKSVDYYPRQDTFTKSIKSSYLGNSGSYHSSSDCSDCYCSIVYSDICATTSDTLGMIDTPWSTESWESRITHIVTPRISTPSKSTSAESALTLTTFTIDPKSSISCGLRSPSLLTVSNETWEWTSLNSVSTFTSATAPAKAHNIDSLDTISSWTVQSFTSAGVPDTETKLRVNYPWSPRTMRSGTTDLTAYPSSVSVEFQSAYASAITPSAATSQIDFERLIPVNYLVLDTTYHIFKP